MTEEQLRQLGQSFGTILLIVGLGILGVLVVVAIFVAWRRSQRRQRLLEEQRDESRHQPAMYTDAWSSAAPRLESDPGASASDPPSSSNERDDDEPWRQSLDDLPDFGDEDEDDERDDDEPWRR